MEREDPVAELQRRLFGVPLAGIAIRLERHDGLRRVWDLIQGEYADTALDLNRASRPPGWDRAR